jgi:hypothetical protein
LKPLALTAVKRPMKLWFALIPMAALAACGSQDLVANNAANTSALPEIEQSSPSPSGAAPAQGMPAGNVVTAAVSEIPADIRGRWGLTPRDCTSPLGDAKGLLVINATELRFYESRGVPAGDVQTSANSISGDFAFTDEGQKWTRHVTLELRDGKLVRTERDPIASFNYVRC